MIHQSKKDIETARQLALEQKGKKADAVVVLGAKVRKDGSMCLMLKERVDLGIQAYKQGLADRIIMSGDHGAEGYDEVSTMKAYAIKQGIPSEQRIVTTLTAVWTALRKNSEPKTRSVYDRFTDSACYPKFHG